MMITFRSILCAALLLPLGLKAQVVLPPIADPAALQQRLIEEEQQRRDAERELRRLPEPIRHDPEPAREAAPEVAEVRFLVRTIEFTPSEILSADELDQVAREFRGRELGMADLRQLLERVNALYRARNVVTARAILPPQDVTLGVVRVQLIEGRVGRIDIRGNHSTEADYILARLGLEPGDLVDLRRLEPALIRFNRTNDAPLRASLMPGAAFATTDLHIDVVEPLRHELRLTLDNHGSSTTGRERTTLSYLNRSLFGYRDQLSLLYSQADGQQSQALGYSFPINVWGGRLGLAYNHDEIAIVHGPLQALNVTGASEGWALNLRQPLLVRNDHQVDLIGGLRQRQSVNWIDGVFLQRTDTRERSLGVEWQRFGPASHMLAGVTRHFVRATTVGTQDFIIDRANLRYSSDLPAGLALRANLALQDARQSLLPSGEMFFIGGEGRVRGYPVGAYAGDDGLALNLELHHPLWVSQVGATRVWAGGFFFIDHGLVRPFRAPGSLLPEQERLTGAGWGMRFTLGTWGQAHLTFARSLTRDPVRERSYEIGLQLVASLP